MSSSSSTPWRTVHRRKNEHMLFAEDLGPPGTKVEVEIVDSGVLMVKGEDGDTRLPWLSFRGKTKKLGLNRGNSKVLESIAGTDIIEQWRGWITLVVIRTTYTDKQTKTRLTTNAIRIAPSRPRSKESQPAAPSDATDEAPQ